MSVLSVLGQFARVVRGALSRGREVRVKVAPSIEAVVYDRPGLWMNDAELLRLRAQIVGVANAAIPGDLAYGVFLPQRAPYENRLIVIGRNVATGDVIGFNAMPQLFVPLGDKTVTVLHLGLLAIHPKYQRRGLQGVLYALGGFAAVHRIPESPVWLSSVTEVPAIVGAVSDNFHDVYPSYGVPRSCPRAHREIAIELVARHRQEFGVGAEARFDDQRFVIKGGYTGGSDALKKTFEAAPKYRVRSCNEFCRRELDYDRGDDLLQIGQIDASVIANWLTRRLPRDLRPDAARRMKLWSYPPRPR